MNSGLYPHLGERGRSSKKNASLNTKKKLRVLLAIATSFVVTAVSVPTWFVLWLYFAGLIYERINHAAAYMYFRHATLWAIPLAFITAVLLSPTIHGCFLRRNRLRKLTLISIGFLVVYPLFWLSTNLVLNAQIVDVWFLGFSMFSLILVPPAFFGFVVYSVVANNTWHLGPS